MTAESDEVAAEDGQNGGLMFAWRQQRPILTYLGIFTAASLIIHLMGFYLFQVVYPASGRLEPAPSRITLLDPSQPSVNALLREIEDRLVYLRPASAGSEVRVSLGDYSAPFQPLFSERSVPFKSVPPIAVVRGGRTPGHPTNRLAASPVDGSPPAGLRLPPVGVGIEAATPEPAARREAADPQSRWRISGGLKDRALLEAGAFTRSLPALGAPPAIRFRIGVTPGGAVRSFLPVAGQSHPRIREVMEAVRTNLRFAPKPEATQSLEWGWLDIRR